MEARDDGHRDRPRERKAQGTLKNQIDDPSLGLRLETTASGQFGVFPDRERDDDQIVEHQGSLVLLVGKEIAQTMGDTTIDCDESRPDPRLVMKHG